MPRRDRQSSSKPLKNQPSTPAPITAAAADVERLVSKEKLQDLTAKVTPGANHEGLVPQILMEMTSEFVENLADFSIDLATHRKSKTWDVKDVLLAAERRWGMDLSDVREKYREEGMVEAGPSAPGATGLAQGSGSKRPRQDPEGPAKFGPAQPGSSTDV